MGLQLTVDRLGVATAAPRQWPVALPSELLVRLGSALASGDAQCAPKYRHVGIQKLAVAGGAPCAA